MDMNLKNTIIQMLQDIYELGHADGWSEGYHDAEIDNKEYDPIEKSVL